MQVFQRDKKQGKLASATLEEIKRDLDPAFSYILFEKDGPADKEVLKDLFTVLDRLGLPLLELNTFQDRSRGKVLLVARFEAGRMETIMEEIIGAGLPEDIVFYGYGSSLSG